MKKEKIVNIIKLIMLMVMLVLLFFISDKFVAFLVTVNVETLKKAVYVILATIVVAIYTFEPKTEKEKNKIIENKKNRLGD